MRNTINTEVTCDIRVLASILKWMSSKKHIPTSRSALIRDALNVLMESISEYKFELTEDALIYMRENGLMKGDSREKKSTLRLAKALAEESASIEKEAEEALMNREKEIEEAMKEL